jgi:chromosome segregation ATPase
MPTSIDYLPDQFQAFIDRAGETFRSEVERWRKIRDTAKGEAATFQTESATLRAGLNALKDQTELAQKKLAEVLANLRRATDLAGIEHDIAEAKKRLEALNAEVAKASATLEKLQRECKTAENRRNEVVAETQAAAQTCLAHRAERDRIRQQLNSIELVR